VHDFIDSSIRKALATFKEAEAKKESDKESGRYIFLQEVARNTNDPLVLRWETINVFIAGRDTTAALLSNTWFILTKRPDIWAKLKAEVDKLEGKPPTYQEIGKMKCLRWVLSESLRLYPVPINARTALKDTTKSEVGRTANPPFSFQRTARSCGVSGPCIDGRISSVRMQTSSYLRGGRRSNLHGNLFHLMGARESASDVSFPFLSSYLCSLD
jgi:hypothetical protein